MTDELDRLPGRNLVVHSNENDPEQLILVAKALSSPQRLRILDFLSYQVANVSEIAREIGLSVATANLHLNSLENAGLIHSEMVAARRGRQKKCARTHDIVVFHLPRQPNHADSSIRVPMPIGAFFDHQVVAPAGLANGERIIGRLDDPASFYEPERTSAQIIWFSHGFLEYRFPYRPEPDRSPCSLSLSAEICSEAVPSHRDWPSDIFLEINGVEIGVWTSPADFGGERGKLTPAWWPDQNSQYGLLKTWRVDQKGASIDGRRLSDVTIDQLNLANQPFIRVRLGVRPDAANVGGMNIYGREFGNHAQNIVLELHQ